MNQQNVVGIGNIYASEILFDASIRPTRKSKTLKKKECDEIAVSAKKILKHAIKAGGTTGTATISTNGLDDTDVEIIETIIKHNSINMSTIFIDGGNLKR